MFFIEQMLLLFMPVEKFEMKNHIQQKEYRNTLLT